MEPVAPRVFSDRYELTHLIARGGMAQVYRARDRLLDRPVALKVLFPELSVDRAFVERFRREAQAAANLSHQNIVPVFDWGEDGGTYFIVMEFVDGRPLSALLRSSGTLSPERATDIAAHVAAALSYAHRHGVVHRDIKPGNVLITDDGQVKVTDFGIARAVNTEESLTQTGAVMGTAAYFSPEQAEGVGVDSRSDIYSLGVVLFEMVTGRTPFLGDTPVAVASKHVRDQPPLPSEINPTVPVELEAVIMKAMAKSPDRRYATAAEMKTDLDRFAAGQPVLAEAPALPLSQSAVDATAAVATVGAATVVGTAASRTRTLPPPPNEDDGGMDDDEDGWPRWMVALLIGLLALLVIAAVLLLRSLGYLGGAHNFALPNVVGQSQAAATSTLEGRGLQVAPAKHDASTQPAGTVTATNPTAGTEVSKGQAVTLTVSTGSPAHLVLVPKLVGLQLTDAVAQLTLPYRVVQEASNQPSGQVLAQSPKPGTSVPSTTTVVLTVSSQTSTTVPNLHGQSQAAAGNLLAQNQLTVGTVSQACSSDNSVPNGDVISSNPASGTSLPPQSAVALVVSTGPCQVILIDVTGQSQAAATATLKGQSSQLTVTPVTVTPGTNKNCNAPQNGNVVAQTPSGGTQVNASSTVTIDVCNANGGGGGGSAPTVKSVSPSNGPAAGGTNITVTGTGFSTSGTAISVGGTSATNVVCNNSTTCTATTPAGTGTADVIVTTSGGGSTTSGADQFTYM